MGVKDTANLAMIPAAYAEDKVYSVLPSDGDGDFTFTRSGSGTRINKGGYIETMGNNVPRLNYRLDADGNVSECAELLLEESRQNLFQRSEEFDNSYWTKEGVSISTGIISPTGGNNAQNMVEQVSTGRHRIRATVSVSSGTTYSFSVWAKSSNRNLVINGVALFNARSGFNLSTGSIENTTSGSATMVRYPNDWFLCTITGTATSTQTTFTYIQMQQGTTDVNYTGDGSSTLSIFGAQLEAGSTSSSYIKTSGSAITRNVDSAYNQPFGDLTSDYPITVYWKGQITNYNAGAFAFSIYDNGSNVRYLGLAWNSTSNFYLYRRSTNNDADLVSYTTQIGDVKKIAIKFTSNTSAKVYIDGIEIYNLSSGLDVDWLFDSVLVGQQRVISDGGKRIPSDELFVWNKALTDAEMVDVTSYDTFAEMATGQQFTIQ